MLVSSLNINKPVVIRTFSDVGVEFDFNKNEDLPEPIEEVPPKPDQYLVIIILVVLVHNRYKYIKSQFVIITVFCF